MIRTIKYLVNLLFFPTKCISCNKYGLWLCHDCYSKIEIIRSSCCPICGIVTKDHRYCSSCRKKYNIYLDSLIVATDYHLRENRLLVWNIKFLGNKKVIPILGDIMLSQSPKFQKSVILTYVPITQKKQKIRGFNQAAILAEYIGEKLNISPLLLLNFSEKIKDQIGLSRRDRFANISGKIGMNITADIAGRDVIVIDDVVTTGATLNECARVFKEKGARKVTGWAFARNLSSHQR